MGETLKNQYWEDIVNTDHPSSKEPSFDIKRDYELPEDPEAEKEIKVKGITTDGLIDFAFQGIDLRTYDGEYLSRTLLSSSINSAIATAEQVLDICITPQVTEEEFHDFEGELMDSYQYTLLFKRPVIEIERVSLMLGTREMLRIPENWIQLNRKMGEVTLFPTSGSAQMIIPQEVGFMPFFMRRNYMPSAFRFSYTAGMKLEDIPANLLEFIYKRAAINVFQVWGDQIIGAGIANQSVSIDGLSQSIGTTQSAMYGGASARIQDYKNDIENLIPILRKYYYRTGMAVL